MKGRPTGSIEQRVREAFGKREYASLTTQELQRHRTTEAR